MIVRIQVRRGTSTQWASSNPILTSGEFGYETDSGKLKIGNGLDTWNVLEYANADIVYFSSVDFQGDGSINDPIRLRS